MISFRKKDGKITNATLIKNLPDGEYLITKAKKKRSTSLNAYYWSCVVPLVKEGLISLGFNEIRNTEDCHELLKLKFCVKKVVNEQTGEFLETLGSTANLSNTEFMALLEDIKQWSAEYLGVLIPDPNEQIEIFK